jgi:flagellar motor switch protein FliN/FliY
MDSMLPTSSSLNSSSSSEPRPEGQRLLVGNTLQAVVCNVDVVLGSSSMSVRECLQLRRNSILKLSESAGADMQVLVNGIPIARGEIVIVEDSTAIRLTDILPSPTMSNDE